MSTRKNFFKKLKRLFWPDMAFDRVILYYQYRMGRLPGTADFIARGFSFGVAISFTPFIGFHLLAGFLLCWLFRGSAIAMVIGTVITGNPWTFPLIWLGPYNLGLFLTGRNLTDEVPVFGPVQDRFSMSTLLDKPIDILLPMTVGSFFPAIVGGIISFYVVRHFIGRYKETMQEKRKKLGK